MRRFRFRFEVVERVRKAKEGEALRSLSEAQGVYQQALAHKSSLLKKLSQALERREKLGIEAVTPVAFRTETDFITGTKQRIIMADQAIVRATRGVEKALRAYLFARKQVRTIEALRERHFLEFKKALAKKEQRDLDDLYTMRSRLVAIAAGVTSEEEAIA